MADPNDPEWHAGTVWRLFTGAEEWGLYTGAEEWPRRQAERKRVGKTVGAIAGAERHSLNGMREPYGMARENRMETIHWCGRMETIHRCRRMAEETGCMKAGWKDWLGS